MDEGLIAVKAFDNFAEEYSSKYMDVTLYAEPLDHFYKAIPVKNARILDLACGPGNVSKYILDKRPDFQLLGVDLSEKMLEIAKENNPNATFSKLDIRESTQLEGNFNGIICAFGLPYLSKSESIQLIHDLSLKLNPGGVLYISTMEDKNENSRFESTSSGTSPAIYMNYHEAGYLKGAFEENELSILLIERLYNPAQKDPSIKDLVIIGSKN